MNNVDQFNKGGFSLWWSFFWLQAISYAWAVVSLLGIFLHSKRSSSEETPSTFCCASHCLRRRRNASWGFPSGEVGDKKTQKRMASSAQIRSIQGDARRIAHEGIHATVRKKLDTRASRVQAGPTSHMSHGAETCSH